MQHDCSAEAELVGAVLSLLLAEPTAATSTTVGNLSTLCLCAAEHMSACSRARHSLQGCQWRSTVCQMTKCAHISVTRPAELHVIRVQLHAVAPALAFQPLMLLAAANSGQLSNSPSACSRISPGSGKSKEVLGDQDGRLGESCPHMSG